MYKPTLNSSVLQSRDENKVNFAQKVFGNHSLRLGLVLEILETDNEKNISKLGPEYDVLAIEQEGSSGSSTTVYKNCITMDSFGGAADYFQMKHRAAKDPSKAAKTGSLKDETGSIVLLLCLDGNSEKAVIISSIQNPSKGVVLDKEKGHHAEGEFNGLNWTIDKDGALKILFKSATEDDGTPKDDEAGGTFVEINKQGSFDVNDGDDKNYIRMDKPNGDIGLLGEENVGLTATNNNVGFNAGKNINMKAGADLIANAEGKAAFTAKSNFDITADGPMKVGASAIQMESKGAFQVSAQSAVQIEAGSSAILKAPTVLIADAAQPALLAFDLITLGTGNKGAPVVSNAIAGFSTAVLIS
jgi:hypothetical protein